MVVVARFLADPWYRNFNVLWVCSNLFRILDKLNSSCVSCIGVERAKVGGSDIWAVDEVSFWSLGNSFGSKVSLIDSLPSADRKSPMVKCDLSFPFDSLTDANPSEKLDRSSIFEALGFCATLSAGSPIISVQADKTREFASSELALKVSRFVNDGDIFGSSVGVVGWEDERRVLTISLPLISKRPSLPYCFPIFSLIFANSKRISRPSGNQVLNFL